MMDGAACATGDAVLITKRGDDMTAETEVPRPPSGKPPIDQTQAARKRGAATGRRRRAADDWRIRVAATLLVAALWGMAAGLWMPRGPITNVEGVSTMLISLVVGGVAGVATRSRWATLLAPTTFIAVFELVRLGTDGPTVDGLHLSTYGVMAFVVGRGVYGVLALLPMALGAALGAGVGRRLSQDRPVRHGWGRIRRYAGRGAAGLVTVGWSCWDRPVLIQSAPGAGKTSLMRTFSADSLDYIARHRGRPCRVQDDHSRRAVRQVSLSDRFHETGAEADELAVRRPVVIAANQGP